jgi:hypothetical protein
MKMKNSILLPLLLVAGAIVRATAQDVSSNSSSPQILTVAVFDFTSQDESVRDLGGKIAALVNANLSAEPNLNIVERAELDKVLGEQEMTLSGTVTPDSAAKIGQLTGAKVLVTGRVFQAGDELILVSKTIGTETSRVYGEMVKGASDASISDLSEQLAKKIAADIAEKGDTLVARVDTHEDRVAEIKKEIAGKKLPAVSVKITEQHFGQPVIDPAAQTELSLILQQCGYTLVDDQFHQPGGR